MAADTDHCHSYFHQLSQPSGLTSDTQQHNQEVSISELIDHGSISFGRFAVESLAWEKWSVFSHNRCQEELEKFKAPGLVAQKKAYFEEYYKKIRAMKKLQAEQQESKQSELCQDKNCIASPVESSVDISKSKEEQRNSADAIPNKILADETIAYRELYRGAMEDEPAVTEQQSKIDSDNVIKRDEIDISATVKSKDFADKVVLAPPVLIKKYTKSSQPNVPISGTVEPSANKLKDRAPLSKAKGTEGSASNKIKVDETTKKNFIKPSERRNASLNKDTICKTTKNSVSGERAPPRAARNVKFENVASNRFLGAARLCPTLHHISVLKDKPASSSSSRGGLAKANMNSNGFMNKSTSKQVTVTNGVNNLGPVKRAYTGGVGKSLEPSSGQSENQRPKVMSTNLPSRSKSNDNIGKELGLRSDTRVIKQIKEVSVGPGRVSTSTSSILSAAPKAPNKKQEHKKIVPRQSVDPTHAQRERRPH